VPADFSKYASEREKKSDLNKAVANIRNNLPPEIRINMKEKEKFGVDIDWKFAGEGESVRDLTRRVNEFQKHLIEKHNVQNILVVTHDFFIRSFVCTALLGEKYDEKSFMKIFGSISCANTSLTLFDYDKKRKHWELVYLNEHLHLG